MRLVARLSFKEALPLGFHLGWDPDGSGQGAPVRLMGFGVPYEQSPEDLVVPPPREQGDSPTSVTWSTAPSQTRPERFREFFQQRLHAPTAEYAFLGAVDMRSYDSDDSSHTGNEDDAVSSLTHWTNDFEISVELGVPLPPHNSGGSGSDSAAVPETHHLKHVLADRMVRFKQPVRLVLATQISGFYTRMFTPWNW